MNESTFANVVDGGRVRRPPAPFLWLGAAGFAAVGTSILYGAKPGLNCPLFTVGMSLLLWRFDADRGHGLWRLQYGLIALACILSAAVAVTVDSMVSAVVVLAVVWLLAVSALLQAGLPLDRIGLPRLIRAPLSAIAVLLREVADRAGDAIHGIRDGRHVPALRGVAWAAPIVTVFFLLLAGADPTLSAWRSAVLQAIEDLSFLPRIAFLVVLAVGLLGAFGVAAAPRAHTFASGLAHVPRAVRSATERCIILGSVGTLFALFLLLQLTVLFGNPGGQTGSGLTYADAVHRGFGELTSVVTMTAFLVIFLDRDAARAGREVSVRVISWMLVGECLLMLASAWRRLVSYEDAYGYTELRVHLHLYMVLVALALLLLGREISGSIVAMRWMHGTLAAGLAILVFAAYWNAPAWIVERNIDRYQRSHVFDTDYLIDQGGLDAVPTIERQLVRLEPLYRTYTICGLRRRYGIAPQVTSADNSWFEWNWRRSAAQRSLLKLAREVVPCQTNPTNR